MWYFLSTSEVNDVQFPMKYFCKKKLPVFSFLSISLGYWIRNEVSVEKNIGYFLYIDLSYTFLTHTEFIFLFKLSKGDESSTLN